MVLGLVWVDFAGGCACSGRMLHSPQQVGLLIQAPWTGQNAPQNKGYLPKVLSILYLDSRTEFGGDSVVGSTKWEPFRFFRLYNWFFVFHVTKKRRLYLSYSPLSVIILWLVMSWEWQCERYRVNDITKIQVSRYDLQLNLLYLSKSAKVTSSHVG